jgi:tetratricopeptide (TPR) repeat protein
MLMKLNTSNPFYYFLRGCAYFGSNSINAAVADWEVAVKMNVKDVQQSASYNLSVAYDSLGDAKKAYYYITKAQSLGYKPAPDFVAKLQYKAGK